MPAQYEKYGALWKTDNPLLIEAGCIRAGGIWRDGSKICGKGLLHHYTELQRLIWPEEDEHRWAMLALKHLVENRITVFMGPASAGKTHPVSKFALMQYWVRPRKSLTLVSTTEGRGLELRIWGRLKEMFTKGRERWPNELEGNIIDSKMAITTDDLSQGETRVLTRGIICVPCASSGRDSGISNYIGAKQEYVKLIGDEAQHLGSSFIDAVSNLNANPNFSAHFMGNPKDPADTLGRVAEPVNGWRSMPVPEKTAVWKTRFLDGVCVNFVGTDSPNFDFPEDKPDRYPYMTGRRHIRQIGATFGTNHPRYYEQCVGVMRSGLLERRVITRELAEQNGAMLPAVWKGDPRTRIYAVDAAYSGVGGDRCVGGWVEFGLESTGQMVVMVHPPTIIPIQILPDKEPEDQIAEHVRADTMSLNISSRDIFYDSTGRGTLGAAFAKVFGAAPPVPVEFGGRATKRPVRHDYYVTDVPNGPQRHKRCDEEYLKFVTELWFSVRNLIECRQLRGIPEDVLAEGCLRQYDLVAGGKIEIESKHDEKALERMGRSPDLFDWLATAVEGCRQRGFRIERLGEPLIHIVPNQLPQWLEDARRLHQDVRARRTLSHS
jgi:hypothetical protein